MLIHVERQRMTVTKSVIITFYGLKYFIWRNKNVFNNNITHGVSIVFNEQRKIVKK